MTNAAAIPRLIAVVVTFNPNWEALKRQLDCLRAQVDMIVLVDNRSDDQLALSQRVGADNQLKWLPQTANHGLATAQNLGIQHALASGASHVLLMDQDIEPAKDMVRKLLGALNTLPERSVVGPAYNDLRRHIVRSPFYRRRGLALRRLDCSDPAAVLAVDHLISSGSLIPKAVLEEVGPLREDFFIDFVDIEWCLRASLLGVGLYGVCAAFMSHDLGETPHRLFGREFPVHSPRRHYYHVRNGICLYRQGWINGFWRLASAWRLLMKIGFHIVFVHPRLEHLKFSWRGLLDGVRGRMGKGL